MADTSFRVVFDGRLADGAHPDAVSRRLAASFQIDERTIDLLFQGKARVIKRGLDKPWHKPGMPSRSFAAIAQGFALVYVPERDVIGLVPKELPSF